jgi:hypothetical protein
MGAGFTFDPNARLGRREWFSVALIAIAVLAFLPIVVWKAVDLGQGDVQVFFRAGWAVWTGYPLYEVADHHGWTYHYPPFFAIRCRVIRSRGGRCRFRSRLPPGTWSMCCA